MPIRTILAKSLAACAAGAMVLTAVTAVPTVALAEGAYDAGGRADYDPCRQEKNDRAIAGGVFGGILGAVVGSNLAAHGVRTEGAVLGGGLGAVAGAAVGSGSAACDSNHQAYDYDHRYDRDADHGPYDRSAYDRDRYDHDRYDLDDYDRDDQASRDMRYDDDTDYAYDREGRTYPVTQGPGPDGCALAESTIYMPDGRTQQRFIRVCRDAGGRYQVVE